MQSIIEEHRDENGKLHRPADLGPAQIWLDGHQVYYEYGLIHRPHELGPSVIGSNGCQEYYEHGKRHRPVTLGPAIIWSTGDQEYYEHGIQHRPAELGPARIWSHGDKEYIEHGKYHRPHELGPAIITSNGNQYYYEHGIDKTLKEFQSIYKIQRWFRRQRFYNRFRELFEKVLGLPANHDSVLGMLFPNGGDLYKETYKGIECLLSSF